MGPGSRRDAEPAPGRGSRPQAGGPDRYSRAGTRGSEDRPGPGSRDPEDRYSRRPREGYSRKPEERRAPVEESPFFQDEDGRYPDEVPEYHAREAGGAPRERLMRDDGARDPRRDDRAYGSSDDGLPRAGKRRTLSGEADEHDLERFADEDYPPGESAGYFAEEDDGGVYPEGGDQDYYRDGEDDEEAVIPAGGPRDRKKRRRRPERKQEFRSRAARSIFLVTLALAAATLVISAFYTRLDQVHWGFFFYLAVFIICAQFDLRLRGGGVINLGLAPLLAALVASGLTYKYVYAAHAQFALVWVLWLFLLGTVAELLVRLLGGRVERDGMFRMLLDYVGAGVMVLAFHLVVSVMPRTPDFFGRYWPGLLMGVAVAAAVYFLVQLVGITLTLSREGYFPAGAYFSHAFRELWIPYLLVGLMGVLMGLVGNGIGLWQTLFILPFLLVTRYAYSRITDTDRYLLETIRTLAIIPEETGMLPGGHAHNIARMSVSVARELGLSPEDTAQVEYAAYLHDIGVLAGGREPEGHHQQLTDEREISGSAAGIISGVERLEIASEILKGREALQDRIEDARRRKAVSAGVGILTAAEDFEALTDGSATGQPMTAEDALSEMNLERGVRYDSKVLRAMARVIARMPTEGKPEVVEGSTESSSFWGEQEDKGT